MRKLFLGMLALAALLACGERLPSAQVQGIDDIDTIRVRCVTGTSEEVTLPDLQAGQVCNSRTFMNFCRERFSTETSEEQKQHIRHTVAVLRDHVGGETCQETFEKLRKLTFIALHERGIVDVSPFMGLTNLRHLDLSGNAIADISPLQSLPQLVMLAVNANRLTTLPVIDMPKLRRLYLSDNSITDLRGLRGMLNLRRLVLDNTAHDDADYGGITNLDGLQNLKRLDHIEIAGVQLRTAAQIEGLTLIRTLNLQHNMLTQIPSLKTAKYLKEVDLSHNQLATIDFIVTNRSLRAVNFNHNQIEQLTALQSKPNLQRALFSANRITDISPLQALYDLETIDFSANAVGDLTPLQRLHQLSFTGVEFADNPVASDSSAATCPVEAVSGELRNYCRRLVSSTNGN